MKKTKITDGNWKIEYNEKVGGYQIVSDVIIAKRIRSQDAKAISAVPEMINALIGLVALHDEINKGVIEGSDRSEQIEYDFSEALIKAKEALKKSGCE